MVRDIGALQPDVVIFHVFADNDYGDLLRNRLFRVTDGVLRRHPNPFTYPRQSLIARMQDFTSTLFVVRAASKLAGLRTQESVTARPPRDPDAYAAKLLLDAEHELEAYSRGGVDSAQVDHYDLDVALHPERPSARAKIELMAAVIGAARDAADRAGVKFLVLIEPSAVDLTTNLTLSYRFLSKFPEYRPERLTQIIEGICAERGIASVNLFPVFKAASPDRLYFRDTDDHWNDAGQDVAAREVAKSVIALLAADRNTRGSTESPMP
jgi:hypothetical protein